MKHHGSSDVETHQKSSFFNDKDIKVSNDPTLD